MCVCAYVYCVVIFLDSGQKSDGYGSLSDVHPQLGHSVSIGTRSKSQASKGSSEGQLKYLIVHANSVYVLTVLYVCTVRSF